MNTTLEHYRTQYLLRLAELPGHGVPAMRLCRGRAMERFLAAGFPHAGMEAWKYTPVHVLAQKTFQLAGDVCSGLDPDDLDPFLVDDAAGSRLVFINGVLSPFLSDREELPAGVRVESLAQVVNEGSLVGDYSRQLLSARGARAVSSPGDGVDDDQGLASLNQALWRDGAHVHIGRGVRLERPLQLLFLSTPSVEPRVTLTRNLVVAEDDARAMLVESHVSWGRAAYFTNAHTTMVLGEGAWVRHLLLLAESEWADHVGSLEIVQGARSRFDSQAFARGSVLTRQEIEVELAGEGAECTLDGLLVARERQFLDFHTRILHAGSATNSRQLYKGVMDGWSRGVFNGVVRVPAGVGQTRSNLTSANLLLSDTAEIDAKPQLEIHADAVQCTHSASVGSLDPEAMFYLQSRGVDAVTARLLLVQGFADELLRRVEPASLRDWLVRHLQLGSVAS